MSKNNILYNEKQLEAINATESKIVIEAPAGAGKTATIVGAIEKYSREHPSDKIVAITFTRKAAAELQNRISALNTEISTIHSWSYRKLQDFAADYNFTVELLDEDTIKQILKTICTKRKQFYVNTFQLYSYIMGNYNIDVDEKIKRVFETIRLDYIKFKQKNKLYDFTDLPTYLYDIMTEYEETITNIDAIFVDEFQDVDPVQLQIFDKVFAKKKVYIGDPKQAIYIFRGATEEVFNHLDDFTVYKLDTNYRSYQEIIDYATLINDNAKSFIEENLVYEFIYENEIYNSSDIICKKGYGGQIYKIEDYEDCVNITEQRNCSNRLIIKSLMELKNTQILCRTNKQVKKIQSYGIDNVSTIHQAKGLEFDNVILTDFPIDCDEECNIAYVGMTRAKNILCLIKFDVLTYIICNENIESNKKLF